MSKTLISWNNLDCSCTATRGKHGCCRGGSAPGKPGVLHGGPHHDGGGQEGQAVGELAHAQRLRACDAAALVRGRVAACLHAPPCTLDLSC